MPRLYIDENGKPYTKREWSEKRFVEVEYPITDKDGKIVSTQKKIEEQIIPHEERIYETEWKKELVYRELKLISGYDRKAKSSLLIPKTALFIVTFKVDASKMSCACNSPQVYVRALPSGLFRTCGSCGVTSGNMTTNSDSIYCEKGITKIDEIEVKPSEAIELFNEGFIHYVDISLRQKLGLPSM